MIEIGTCNICGGGVIDKFELSFKDVVGMAHEYTQIISVCNKCGFIFTKNPFCNEQLEDRYMNFSKFEFDSNEYILDESEDYRIRSIRQKSFIDRVVGVENVMSILEIGAASGFNLSLYKNQCKVYGIEPSRKNCINALELYGIEMYQGMCNQYFEKKLSVNYDMIFLSHVLEHIINPRDFILQCKKINHKYIFIEVPSFDYKFVDEPFGMFGEEHVNMFTLESLENLMNSCGYELLNVDMIMGIEQNLPAGWPAISTMWIKKIGNIKKHEYVMESYKLLDEYISKSIFKLNNIKMSIDKINKDKRLAVWGTGHHASMLLANTSLINKNIVKVYDSDERKWGKCLVEFLLKGLKKQIYI